MSHVRRFDHVGITVADLDTVTAFFVGLGLEVEGTMLVEGEFVDTVIGIPDSLAVSTLHGPGVTELCGSGIVRGVEARRCWPRKARRDGSLPLLGGLS